MSELLNKLRYWLAPKDLKAKADELFWLKLRVTELRDWCAYESPEIGHAMNEALHPKQAVIQEGRNGN